jgi:dTDP-4-dehydrorhamnose 3,5-epimerase
VKITVTDLPGVLLIEPQAFGDERGFFLETFQAGRYRALAGISAAFVQHNHARSQHRVLRGLHFQKKHRQGKLVRAARGARRDLRRGGGPRSALSDIRPLRGRDVVRHEPPPALDPAGLCARFRRRIPNADVEYKCTDYRHPQSEVGVIWNDPDLAIRWPIRNPTLSEKDKALPTLAELGSIE